MIWTGSREGVSREPSQVWVKLALGANRCRTGFKHRCLPRWSGAALSPIASQPLATLCLEDRMLTETNIQIYLWVLWTTLWLCSGRTPQSVKPFCPRSGLIDGLINGLIGLFLHSSIRARPVVHLSQTLRVWPDNIDPNNCDFWWAADLQLDNFLGCCHANTRPIH